MNMREALAAQVRAAALDWIVPEWPVPENIGALSTTRRGGVSVGPAGSMDLGLAAGTRGGGDSPTSLSHNRQRLAAFVPSAPIWLRQVHGNSVTVLDAATSDEARAAPPVADAAVTRERGIVCAVLTADCLPVLLADRAGTTVGVAHAGWRGMASGVIEAAVEALIALGAARHELVGWLGPAIGPHAFEVGADVRDAFAASDAGAVTCFAPLREGKWLADLYALARRRLAAVGVDAVYGGGECTRTDAARFYSYRREPDTGRMATLVWLDAKGADPRL
jgi:YfiH family protein